MYSDLAAKLRADQVKENDAWKKCKSFYGDGYRRKHKVPNKKPNLICANCGKVYGNKDIKIHSKTYPLGTPVEPYNGNLMIVEEWLAVGPNMGPNHSPGARMDRYLWDGETYRSPSGTEPFCTIQCARDFGISAYRAGYRMKPKDRK